MNKAQQYLDIANKKASERDQENYLKILDIIEYNAREGSKRVNIYDNNEKILSTKRTLNYLIDRLKEEGFKVKLVGDVLGTLFGYPKHLEISWE